MGMLDMVEMSGLRPLLTLIASGRSGGYESVSCRLSYFKAIRQHSRLPTGRIRPITVRRLSQKQTFNMILAETGQ